MIFGGSFIAFNTFAVPDTFSGRLLTLYCTFTGQLCAWSPLPPLPSLCILEMELSVGLCGAFAVSCFLWERKNGGFLGFFLIGCYFIAGDGIKSSKTRCIV